jgi:hypothetical protein
MARSEASLGQNAGELKDRRVRFGPSSCQRRGAGSVDSGVLRPMWVNGHAVIAFDARTTRIH